MEQHETTGHEVQRREYRRPAAPEVVASIPSAAASYSGVGQDLQFYASGITT